MKTKATGKKLLALLLTLVMVLGMQPVAAFATVDEVDGGNSELADSAITPAVCCCEAACTEDNMNPGCLVCGAEDAAPADCAVPSDYVAEEEAAVELFAAKSELPTPNFYLTISNMPENTDPSPNLFQAGDEIEYRFVVDNTTEHVVIPSEVKLRWGDEEKAYENTPGIWTNPAETRTYGFRFRHIVTEEEARIGQVFVEATMEYEYWLGGDEYAAGPKLGTSLTTPVGEYAGLGGVYVYKVATNEPSNGTYFVEGETVDFTTYVFNDTEHSLGGLKVTEDRNGSKQVIYTAPSKYYLAPGQTQVISSSVVVSHTDCLLRSLCSYSTATWNDEEAYYEDLDASVTSNVVRVPVGSEDGSGADEGAFVSIEISAENPPANGVFYEPGEQIRIKYVVRNRSTGAIAKDVSFSDSLRAMNLMDPWELGELHSAWSGSTTYTYTINVHDLLGGEFKLQAYVDAWDKDTGKYCGSISNTLVLPVSGAAPEWWQDQDIDLTQELVNEPANGEFFEPGETVRIAVTSHMRIRGVFKKFSTDTNGLLHYGTGSEALHLEDLELTPGGVTERSQTITHTVTPEDAEQGWIRSDVYGTVSYRIVTERDTEHGELHEEIADGGFFYTGDPLVVPCGWPEVEKPKVKLIPGVPDNGAFFVAGEEVELYVSIDNGIHGAMENIAHSLSRYTEHDGVQPAGLTWIDELEYKGDGYYIGRISYTATEADEERGKIALVYGFTATFADGLRDLQGASELAEVPCGRIAEYTDLAISQIETSVPANGEYYLPGETIAYRIDIANRGEEDFGECVVSVSNLEGELGSVDQLAVGESESFDFGLVVEGEMIQFGQVANEATVETVHDGKKVQKSAFVYSRAAEEVSVFGIALRIANQPDNSEYFTVGETIIFEFALQEGMTGVWETMADNGCIVSVVDARTGEVIPIDLTSPESLTGSVDYIVTTEDVAAGGVTDIATLQWIDPGEPNCINSMNSNEVGALTGGDVPVGPGEDDEPTPAEYAIEVTKVVEGESAPADASFTFLLSDELGTVVDTVAITGAGTAEFQKLSFPAAGNYIFTVTERNDGASGWTYDPSSIVVRIKVVQDRGLRIGSVAYREDDHLVDGVSFSNSYNDDGEEPGGPGDQPGDQPGDNPDDQPGGNPGDQPGDNPGDRPGDNPGDRPGENPDDQPTTPETPSDPNLLKTGDNSSVWPWLVLALASFGTLVGVAICGKGLRRASKRNG